MRHALGLFALASACVTPMEMEELENKVVDLESRLAALEGKTSAVAAGSPGWVARGSVDTGTGYHFFGVGSVKGIANHALARVTADNRARAEVARLVEAAAVHGGHFTDPEQIRRHVNATLGSVRILDHWIAPDGSVYSLAELNASP
jgi:hypothetical protein